jgi:hypothetical protein
VVRISKVQSTGFEGHHRCVVCSMDPSFLVTSLLIGVNKHCHNKKILDFYFVTCKNEQCNFQLP